MTKKVSSEQPLVQSATIADVGDIIALINGAAEYLLPRGRAEIIESIHNFVVIKEKGKVVACASLENYAPKIAEIRSVVVNTSCRGKGYGELMVMELLKRVKPKQEVFVVTSKIAYFKKLGFDFTLNNEKQILFFQRKEKK